MDHRNTRVIYFAVVLLAGMSVALASGSGVIGLATTSDLFILDGVEVHGNASVDSGSVVRSTNNPVWIALQNGSRVGLAAESSGVLYRDHMVLDRGASQAKSISVLAHGIRVSPDRSGLVRVSIQQSSSVGVTAVSGTTSVFNHNGQLIAALSPGRSLLFTEQDTGAGAPTQITGCIERIRGTTNYVIRDETTNVVYQVAGPDVETNVGKTVQLSGSPDASATVVEGANQLIRETTVTALNREGCKSEIPAAAAAVVAGGAAGAGAATGAGGGAASAAGGISGATIAIIGAVVVSGVIGGLAAAGAFSSSSSTTAVSP